MRMKLMTIDTLDTPGTAPVSQERSAIDQSINTGGGEKVKTDDILLGSGVIILFIFILVGVLSACCFSLLYICKKRRNQLHDLNTAYREYYEEKAFETTTEIKPSQVMPLDDTSSALYTNPNRNGNGPGGTRTRNSGDTYEDEGSDDGEDSVVRFGPSSLHGPACSFENPLYVATNGSSEHSQLNKQLLSS